MEKIREVIIVEGRYDKNTVSQVVDAVIVETGGFSVFNDREKRDFIKRLARERGIIVFTDGDGAGFMIRNHLKGMIPASEIKHAYIPDVYGKEKRKSAPSKEGKLGVEGMSRDVIISALKKAGATFENGGAENACGGITKTDLFELGLSGCEGSSEKRRAAAIKLGLPERISANAMLAAVNILYSRDEFIGLIG